MEEDEEMTICDACGREVPMDETYDLDGAIVCPECNLAELDE